MGREEHCKSSVIRRFCCVLCASSSLPTCSPYPGHVDALSNASTVRCTLRISVHKYHSVRHDQREPSAVSAHDEDETGEFVRRPAPCAAGGSSVSLTAPEERNRSAAAPLNQYDAPVLSGAPELAALKERLQPAGDHGRKKQSLSAVQHGLGYCTQALHFCSCATCDVSACLRCVLARFFA